MEQPLIKAHTFIPACIGTHFLMLNWKVFSSSFYFYGNFQLWNGSCKPVPSLQCPLLIWEGEESTSQTTAVSVPKNYTKNWSDITGSLQGLDQLEALVSDMVGETLLIGSFLPGRHTCTHYLFSRVHSAFFCFFAFFYCLGICFFKIANHYLPWNHVNQGRNTLEQFLFCHHSMSTSWYPIMPFLPETLNG